MSDNNLIIQLQQAIYDYEIFLDKVRYYLKKSKINTEESIQIQFSNYLFQVLKARDKVEKILQSLEYPSPKEIEEIKKLDRKFKHFKKDFKNQQIITKVKKYSKEMRSTPPFQNWWWKNLYTIPLYRWLNYPCKFITLLCIFCIVVIIFRNLDLVRNFGFDFTEILKVSASSIAILGISATFFGKFRKIYHKFLSRVNIDLKWHDETVAIFSLVILIIIIWLFIFNIPNIGKNALIEGDKLLKQGEYIQAENQYQKALIYLNSENTKKTNIQKMIGDFFDVSVIQQKHPLVLFKLGQVYYQKLDLDKAEKYYQKAISLETNKDSVFYMDYLNNLAKIIILKSYGFPLIYQEDSDNQSSTNKNKAEVETAKFLLDLSMSIYSDRTYKLFCQKLEDAKKKNCLNKDIFTDILKRENENISQHDDIDLYNYEQTISENNPQDEQLDKLYNLRLKYLQSYEIGKFNYGLYELSYFKNIKDSKDIQDETKSFKNKLDLVKDHFKWSSVHGAVIRINRELYASEIDGNFREKKLTFSEVLQETDLDKVKTMKSFCFFRLSQFMQIASSPQYIQYDNQDTKKNLDKQMIGDNCYKPNNRPIDTLDFYEAKMLYNLRRIPGFPKNPK